MEFNNRNFALICVVLFCNFIYASAQNDEDKNMQCAGELMRWCENMTNFNNQFGTYISNENSNGVQQTIYCLSGSGGTNCTRNNHPWFACARNGSVTYKNSALQDNSSNGLDDGICEASKKAISMFSFDTTAMHAAFDEGKKQYDRAMANLRRTMGNLQASLSRPCFPFCGMVNPFGPGFPFNG